MTTTPPKELKLDDIETTITELVNRITARENEIADLQTLVNKDKELIKKLRGEQEEKDKKEEENKKTADRIRGLLKTAETKLDKLGTDIGKTKALFEVPPKSS